MRCLTKRPFFRTLLSVRGAKKKSLATKIVPFLSESRLELLQVREPHLDSFVADFLQLPFADKTPQIRTRQPDISRRFIQGEKMPRLWCGLRLCGSEGSDQGSHGIIRLRSCCNRRVAIFYHWRGHFG